MFRLGTWGVGLPYHEYLLAERDGRLRIGDKSLLLGAVASAQEGGERELLLQRYRATRPPDCRSPCSESKVPPLSFDIMMSSD